MSRYIRFPLWALAAVLILRVPSVFAGLSVSTNGVLLLNGVPYRGMGVNGYDLFVRTIEKPSSTNSLDDFFRPLAERGIPFVRFSACGYWPVEWGLYRTNPAAHFARMDAVVAAAARHKIGLIPSLFWHGPTVPDVVGEPFSSWGDSKSRTRALMREYTAAVVRRYRDSEAVWAWEFGNEHNLPADLPNAADHRPPIVPTLGTPATRTSADDISQVAVRDAVRDFAEEVRRHDPVRAIISGHAFPRVSAWHQEHRRSWGKDSPEQFDLVFAADNPDPINILSVRLYEPTDSDRLPLATRRSKSHRKPLFVGEFGVPGAITDESRRKFREMLDAITSREVPLSALWVYGYSGQDADWNVTPTNRRAELLDLVAKANRDLQNSSR